MLRSTTVVVGVAAVVAALIQTFTSQAASPVVRTINATHMGKTAQEWHRLATERRLARDWLQHRLAIRVRELRTLQRRFKAAPDRPPHYQEWLCIHEYEGAWNDPNAPYYGGLQFAHSTWERNGGHRYAAEADGATPVQQMWIAENAWRESGGSFAQWPLTARYCGLL
jgi:hypothetical protein